MELYSGDIIHLVFRKDEPESSRYSQTNQIHSNWIILDIVFEIDLPLLKSDEDLSIYDEGKRSSLVIESNHLE